MELKFFVLLALGSCFANTVPATKPGNGDIDDAIMDRLATLEATVYEQATHRASLEAFLREQTERLVDTESNLQEQTKRWTDSESKLQEQTERLTETEWMLRQQKDINAALFNSHVVTDRKLKEIAKENGQLLKELSILQNLTYECKGSGLDVEMDNKALLRDSRQGVETIAFTAYLDHELQHLGIDHPIPYNQVLLNEGAAYHPSNGIFICPDDGFYVFYFQVSTNGVNQIVAKLVVDGVNQVDGISDTYHQYHEAQGGNMAITKLKRGQSVWVANYRGAGTSTQTSEVYRFATFSGFRIY